MCDGDCGTKLAPLPFAQWHNIVVLCRIIPEHRLIGIKVYKMDAFVGGQRGVVVTWRTIEYEVCMDVVNS